MKYLIYGRIPLLFFAFQVIASEYVYKKATIHDLPKLRALMESAAATNASEMFIPPVLFRDEYLAQKIQLGCMYFAATNDNNPIACAKLRVVSDEQARKDLLESELSLIGNTARYVTDMTFLKHEDLDNTTILERGTEYTLPAYRAKGINSALFEYAFDSTVSCIIADAKNRKSERLALAYGLVAHNAFRALAINKQFFAALKAHNFSEDQEYCFMQSFAQKPGCNPSAERFEIDPTLMVPGFGNLCLVAFLKKGLS